MSRVVTALCLIAVIMGYSAFAAVVIRNENREITAITEEIISFSESEEKEKAVAAAERLSREWYSFERRMSVFVRDDKLNNISSSVARIKPYIEEANDELEAELENISHQLSIIYRTELPVWYNIL